MREFLQTQGVAFEPETIEVMVRAFDTAWAIVEDTVPLPSQAQSARLGHRKVTFMHKTRLQNLQKKIRQAERLLANLPADDRPAAERLIAILREEVELLRLLINPPT